MPNRLADETSPVPAPARRQPGRLVAVGRGGARASAKREDKPILLSIGYAACHWCHVMAHESFEDAATARADERAVRQHQGRPRGAARRRQDLHEAHPGADAAQRRLAADGVPDAGRRAVLRRHVLSEGAALRHAGFARAARARVRRVRRERTDAEDSARRADRRAAARRRARAAAPAMRPRSTALARGALGKRSRERSIRSTAASAARRSFRKRDARRSCSRAARAGSVRTRRRSTWRAHARAHGRGRHLRSSRRRLRPLLRRCAVAGPALREDAVRQRAAARALRRGGCREARATPVRARSPRETVDWVVREMRSPAGRLLLARSTPTARARRASSTSGTPDEVRALLDAE